jgi:glycosyltransferase involved in cell wall biosynthesis
MERRGMISVLILTRDEESNLPRCLRSVAWSDDVVVFDSFSTDRTLEIARAAGARVVQREFDDERCQREAALRVTFKYPWVYNPDADEVTPDDLALEMQRAVADRARPEVAYRMRFKTMFMGRWIKHSSLYPTWVVRLFRPERVRFERTINLRYVVDGAEGKLQGHFEHYSFNNGLNAWFEKHNRYSWHEALENIKALRESRLEWRDGLTFDPVRRRRFLKDLSLRLPFRPTSRFVYMYFLRRGFLDGWAGWTYCRLLAMYEQMIVLKMRELERREAGLGT